MKKDFDIKDEWLAFEIHPETPPEGVLLAKHLPHIDWDEMYGRLRLSGAQYGIKFGQVSLLSNSRMALEAGEFALDHGKFGLFHEKIFCSYFTKTRDIGNMDVIIEIAGDVGLNSAELRQVLNEKRYFYRLENVTREAHKNGINSAPTFIIEDKFTITGAQPIDVFREILSKIQ